MCSFELISNWMWFNYYLFLKIEYISGCYNIVIKFNQIELCSFWFAFVLQPHRVAAGYLSIIFHYFLSSTCLLNSFHALLITITNTKTDELQLFRTPLFIFLFILLSHILFSLLVHFTKLHYKIMFFNNIKKSKLLKIQWPIKKSFNVLRFLERNLKITQSILSDFHLSEIVQGCCLLLRWEYIIITEVDLIVNVRVLEKKRFKICKLY